jgi:hypothetical protein
MTRLERGQTNMTDATPTLTVLILPREGGLYVAQTLEHAFAATGPTREGALDSLCEVLQGQAALDREAGRPPITWMSPAREEYRDVASRIRGDMPERPLTLFPAEEAGGAAEVHLRLAPVG